MRKVGLKAWARWTTVAAAAAMVVGCGDDPVAVVVPPPAGFVVQFPVEGATVFADRLTGGTRGVMDEGEIRASTDSEGRFQFGTVPSYDYELISFGGTDTSGRPGISMRAAGGTAGSAPTTDVLTPLTTLVQLAPANQRAAVIQKIQSLGVTYTDRIDQKITPAAAALVKAVTTTLTVVSQAISSSSQNSNGVALSGAADKAIQNQLVSSLATSLANTATPLASVQAIQNLTRDATQDALVTLTAPGQTLLPAGVSVTIPNIASVANSVSQSAAAVAQSIAGAGVATLSTEDLSEEAIIINTEVQQTLETQQTAAAATASAEVIAVVPANKPPTISGQGTASGTSGRAFSYSPTISDPDGDSITVTVSSGTLPAGLILNSITGVISGTPTTATTRTVVLTVSDTRDGSDTLSLEITISPPPSGADSTGGSNS